MLIYSVHKHLFRACHAHGTELGPHSQISPGQGMPTLDPQQREPHQGGPWSIHPPEWKRHKLENFRVININLRTSLGTLLVSSLAPGVTPSTPGCEAGHKHSGEKKLHSQTGQLATVLLRSHRQHRVLL